MSDRYENREAVRAKIEWEGGLVEAVDYGVKSTDMPHGDDELIAAWGALETAYRALTPLADAVQELLDEAHAHALGDDVPDGPEL